MIDEAGQLELAWLPGEVATIAGLGALFVTCWQSKAQITHRYGTLADAVLGGHRSKVIFNGTDDPATLDYLSRIAGTEHVAQRGWSADVAGGRKTVSEHVQREDLIPAHVIRQMHRHEAVLIHGTLPPVHLKAVLWWEDPELRNLVPTDADGRPVPPTDALTCPLTAVAADEPGPTLDPAAISETAAHLPGPKARSTVLPPTRAQKVNRGHGVQLDLLEAAEPAPPSVAGTGTVIGPRNRSAGVCAICLTMVGVGAGTTVVSGSRNLIRCRDHSRVS